MGVVNLDFPLSKALIVLNLLLPGIQFTGWAIARRLFDDRLAAQVISVCISLSSWLLCTHLVALATHSLSIGLGISSVALGTAGYALWFRNRRRQQPTSLRSQHVSWEIFVFAAALTLPIALAAWRWSFHDELGIGGHQSMIANIQNDYYPPRSLSFPQFDLAYHYGFNVLCAMLTALWRIPITYAIDFATTALWFYCVVAAWLLGERTIGTRAGPLSALVLLIGGGFPWTCPESTPQSIPFAYHFMAFCSEGDVLLNPSMASYFFQHPWTLGLPIALTILLVESEWNVDTQRLRVGALAVLFAALYLTQVVLFLTLLAAVCASHLLTERTLPMRRRWATILTLVAFGIAEVVLLGGFLGRKSSNASALEFHLGIANTPVNSLWWMLNSFGLPLLGLVGFIWLPRKRLLYASLVLGGIVIINVVRYKLTWDIVKFATVASMGLAIPWAAMLHRMRQSSHRPIHSWLPASLLVVTLAPSSVFLVVLALAVPGVPGMYGFHQPSMTNDARAAATFLRRHMPHDAVMYRRFDDYLPYAAYGGLPQVWLTAGLPADEKLVLERVKLVETFPDAPETYLRQRVRYFVLDSQDTRVNVVVDAWLNRGVAVLRGRFGPLRVVELLERKGA